MYPTRILLQISVNQSTSFLLKVLDVLVALNFEQIIASAFPLGLLSCTAGWGWLWTGQLLFYRLWNSFNVESARLTGQLSTYIPLATIWKRGRKSRFPLTEDTQIDLLQPLRKRGASKISHFCSSIGIFLAKEPHSYQYHFIEVSPSVMF